MSKMNLQNSFKEFCKQNRFEVNVQQIEILNSLNKFLYQRETFLSLFLKKKKNFAFIYMEKLV